MQSSVVLVSIIIIQSALLILDNYFFKARPKWSTMSRISYKETQNGDSKLTIRYDTKHSWVEDEHILDEDELEMFNGFVIKYANHLNESTNGDESNSNLRG